MKTPKKFKKKPVVIQAIRFVGTNAKEVLDFVHSGGGNCRTAITSRVEYYELGEEEIFEESVLISTLEGVMTASIGDYIIRGVKGEFYPCRPDIFASTFEEVLGEIGS